MLSSICRLGIEPAPAGAMAGSPGHESILGDG